MTPRVVAFVHASGAGSRAPGEHLRVLGDRPLFCHAIAHARAARRVDDVVIESDDDTLLSIGASHGARPLKRPARLATGAASGDDLAFWQATSAPHAELVLQVAPTAPFLSPDSIDAAVDLLREHGVDSVVGCRCEALYLWRGGRPAYFRPDGSIPDPYELEPLMWETTGLYASRTAAVLRLKKRMNPDSCLPLVLDPIEAVDVDTPEDFALAEALWRGSRGNVTAAPAAPASR